MKELMNNEIEQVSGASGDLWYDDNGQAYMNYRDYHGISGLAPCVMVPLSPEEQFLARLSQNYLI